MAKEGRVRVGSAWRKTKTAHVRVGSTWRNVKEGYVRVGSAWKQWYASGPAITTVQLPSYTSFVRTVRLYNNTFFVSADNYIATSTDGLSWTRRSNTQYSGGYDVIYGQNKYITLNSSSLSTSTNGTTWTVSSPTNLIGTRGAFGNNTWVSVGTGAATMQSSPDAVTWTRRSNGLGTSRDGGVVFANGKFTIFCSDGCASSTDGITWTLGTKPTLPGTVGPLSYGNGIYLASGNNFLVTSTNGTSWTVRNHSAGNINQACFGNGKFWGYSTTTPYNIYTTVNGVSWEKYVTPPSYYSCYTLCAAKNMLLLGSGAGNIIVFQGMV